MIKYLGSKRRIVPGIAAAATVLGARTAVDAFSGTTRVGQALKRAGMHVTSNDIASYSLQFGRTWIEADADEIDVGRLQRLIDRLNRLDGQPGYVTRTFCEESRFFHPDNGARIDAIRAAIDDVAADAIEHAILLTALLLAADRVDSTTGVQMAYLKAWAPRAARPLELQMPELIAGTGRATRGDAAALADTAAQGADLWYLDPPYNQHSYFSNYHIWETIVRADAPESYGVARKRVDCREQHNPYNRRREAAAKFASLVDAIDAEHVLVSLSNEGFHDLAQVEALLRRERHLAVVEIPHRRYVGAQIGIHDPSGERVGEVSHTTNVERLFVASSSARHADAAAEAAATALAGMGARCASVRT